MELSDWLYNAGIVGLANILDYNDVPYKTGINYIEFDSSHLENFAEKYFRFFINKYEKFTSWYKIISFESFIDSIDIEHMSEKDLNYVNAKIDEIK